MNAREVLGLDAKAGDEEIRAAYLRLVKEYPPEKAPEEFERIRDAYETLRDPRRRAREVLFGGDPFTPLADLVGQKESQRMYVGPAAWREALKGK
jgi:DnaJ-class molecular chaperone